jgi:hypothetical protein
VKSMSYAGFGARAGKLRSRASVESIPQDEDEGIEGMRWIDGLVDCGPSDVPQWPPIPAPSPRSRGAPTGAGPDLRAVLLPRSSLFPARSTAEIGRPIHILTP